MFISLYTAMKLNLRLPMILVVNVSAPSPMIFSLLPSLWQNLYCRQRSKEAVQNCRLSLHMWQRVWIASRCENYFFCIILSISWVWWIHLQESKNTPMIKKAKTKTLVFRVSVLDSSVLSVLIHFSIKGAFFYLFLIHSMNLFYQYTLWDLWGKFLSMG